MTLFPAVKVVSSLLQTDLSLKQKKKKSTVNAFFFPPLQTTKKLFLQEQRLNKTFSPTSCFQGKRKKNFFSSLNISSPST